MGNKTSDSRTIKAVTELALPNHIRTRGGAIVNPNDDVWSFKDGPQDVRINFTKAMPPCDAALTFGLKMTLVWYVENKSSSYVVNLFTRMAHFLRYTAEHQSQSGPLTCIRSQDVMNYRAQLSVSNEWYLRIIGILLLKWHNFGYGGIDADAVEMARQMRLKPNARGVAVLTMDVHNGPYSDIEMESIQDALDDAYAKNEIAVDDYLLVYLFILLSARPVQYASLKLCDFRVSGTSEGGIEYCLQVPRVKQRHGRTRFEFKARLITHEVGEILQAYVEKQLKDFAGVLDDAAQAPMFRERNVGDASLGFEYHCTSVSIRKRLQDCLDSLQVRSERTGEPLHITATRFRRTLGTRAAAEGHGELIIAELLDHSDTSNAGVYVNATPAIIERIDRAVALQMAPLAQAFAGVLIKSEAEAVRSGDPASRIMDPRIDSSMRPMGNCGKHGFCGRLAPIACYTCANFQPWLDGPHEAVLNYLITERDRLFMTTDMRIASVNDRTILAVAEVVRRCEKQRGGALGDSHG